MLSDLSMIMLVKLVEANNLKEITINNDELFGEEFFINPITQTVHDETETTGKIRITFERR